MLIHLSKILILEYEEIIEKNYNRRRVYESVDDRGLYWVESHKYMEKELKSQRVMHWNSFQ